MNLHKLQLFFAILSSILCLVLSQNLSTSTMTITQSDDNPNTEIEPGTTNNVVIFRTTVTSTRFTTLVPTKTPTSISLNPDNLPSTTSTQTQKPSGSGGMNPTTRNIIIIVVCIVVALIGVVIAMLFIRKKKQQNNRESLSEFPEYNNYNESTMTGAKFPSSAIQKPPNNMNTQQNVFLHELDEA
ncbi:hypothetical protein BB559_001803 [Furculomyces boomerangus]|uniref:Mid2 domain-containing protein n=2 Tax=Harpellales TaxID=61421 RepID=A0A2T9Z0E4_9FUNG|nr:hypothetical protein BB559_001803 [Furculomyces boomerangus]PWA02848.1 hypothetical protein BB558_000993 [Smittium angustum]